MTKREQMPDGIHIGLNSDLYHQDDALGSSSLKNLNLGAFEYWWNSPLNPARPDDDPTQAQAVGTAIHKIVLEGRQAFDAIYVRRPDDERGASSADKSAVTRAANAAAAKLGKESLKGRDYDRTIIAGAMVAKNPDLATAFSGGLAEVSIFWTERVPLAFETAKLIKLPDHLGFPVRCKMRGDYLKATTFQSKPRLGIGDLKSVANERRRPFPQACRYAIRDYRHDLQVAQYLKGATAIPAFVTDGRVFFHGTVSEKDREAINEKLARMATAAQEDMAFQFVFFQKSGAPRTWSRVYSPENEKENRDVNPLLRDARIDRDKALALYAECVTKYGPGEAWIDHDPVEEMSESEMPPMYF